MIALCRNVNEFSSEEVTLGGRTAQSTRKLFFSSFKNRSLRNGTFGCTGVLYRSHPT
jgi:hypothetical protein